MKQKIEQKREINKTLKLKERKKIIFKKISENEALMQENMQKIKNLKENEINKLNQEKDELEKSKNEMSDPSIISFFNEKIKKINEKIKKINEDIKKEILDTNIYSKETIKEIDIIKLENDTLIMENKYCVQLAEIFENLLNLIENLKYKIKENIEDNKEVLENLIDIIIENIDNEDVLTENFVLNRITENEEKIEFLLNQIKEIKQEEAKKENEEIEKIQETLERAKEKDIINFLLQKVREKSTKLKKIGKNIEKNKGNYKKIYSQSTVKKIDEHVLQIEKIEKENEFLNLILNQTRGFFIRLRRIQNEIEEKVMEPKELQNEFLDVLKNKINDLKKQIITSMDELINLQIIEKNTIVDLKDENIDELVLEKLTEIKGKLILPTKLKQLFLDELITLNNLVLNENLERLYIMKINDVEELKKIKIPKDCVVFSSIDNN